VVDNVNAKGNGHAVGNDILKKNWTWQAINWKKTARNIVGNKKKTKNDKTF
jgi:hypothetical protein|tara:strand:- start:621 stop:773 length:153 start_codon:yes stop_codon:yes gene_type:complete